MAIRRPPPRHLAVALAAALAVVAGVALAVSQILELEVIETGWDPEARLFVVSAAHRGTGPPLRFTLEERALRGKQFYANLEGVGVGDLFSITGEHKLRLQARELTWLDPEGDYSPRQPDPHPGGSLGRTERFTTVTVDGATSRVTAVSSNGTLIEFSVDHAPWKGYPIVISPAHITLGKSFLFFALNAGPVKDCCRLLSRED